MEITYGRPIELAQGVRRLTCNNPSALTGVGTNTYLLGTDDVTIIDPGPMDDSHLKAILQAAPTVSQILVTHSHLDHSPLAAPLAQVTGAPICGFGPSGAGTSSVMATLPDLGGSEGVDHDFAPTRLLKDAEQIETSLGTVTAHHTPGHFGNHMTFEIDGIVFSGDLVMGWATSLISPPHGDLTDFMASCRALLARTPKLLLPGHGDTVTDPSARITWLIEHRMAREAQILAALTQVPTSIPDLTARVYADIEPHLWPAAQRNVLAHLIDLTKQNRIICDGPLGQNALFRHA